MLPTAALQKPPRSVWMKDLDASIIALLKRNARMSVTQMSHELGASRVTINSHIRKMEQSGIITGYTVTLGAEEFRHKVSGWVMITVDASKEEAVIDELAGMPQIARLFTTNGRWDLAAEIQTSTLESLDAAISRLRQIPGIKETDTSLLLSSRVG